MGEFPLTGIPIIDSIIYGVVGALLYCAIAKWAWEEAPEWARRVFIGALIGLLYPATGLPNHIVTAAISYAGIDAIEALLFRFLPKEEDGHDNR